jgi:hypothetical protein
VALWISPPQGPSAKRSGRCNGALALGERGALPDPHCPTSVCAVPGEGCAEEGRDTASRQVNRPTPTFGTAALPNVVNEFNVCGSQSAGTTDKHGATRAGGEAAAPPWSAAADGAQPAFSYCNALLETLLASRRSGQLVALWDALPRRAPQLAPVPSLMVPPEAGASGLAASAGCASAVCSYGASERPLLGGQRWLATCD